MQIGEVIRSFRKQKNITQEELARRLGVTAPAVNKWENGHTLPDIALLSPLARLLDISLDTLLSHQQELSPAEIERLVEQANARLKQEDFATVFAWGKQRIAEYPTCYRLILWLAQLFDSQLTMSEATERSPYDDYLVACYEQVLAGGDDQLTTTAAELLFNFYLRSQLYEQAERYLDYLPPKAPERQRKQAMIYSRTNRVDEARAIYQELLFSGYQNSNQCFHGLYLLALEEGDFATAHLLADKLAALARLFEFGAYHEIAPALELATLEQDVAATLHIAQRMLGELHSIHAFTTSPLYAQMPFKQIEEDFFTELRQELLHGFADEETYGYMQNEPQWTALIGRE